MGTKKITVEGSKEAVGSQDGYLKVLKRFNTECLVDTDGFSINDFESLVNGGTYTRGAETPAAAAAAAEPPIGDLAAEMQAMRLEIHGVRETLPSVLVGHVITPSQASRIPQVVSTVFDSLGLSLTPLVAAAQYQLPTSCGKEWEFSWQWKSAASMDDRVLERTSYKPVQKFLRRIGLFCLDVSEGQCCVEKLLFNADVYTKRARNPFLVRGQDVFLRHRVQGRSDLAVLRADNGGDYILRHMVKFVVEIKTVDGYRQSQTGCMREAQLQLIGLNAFNTNNSPPVVLSNLAKTHQVLYLDKDEHWNYSIRVVNCSSFAAAIHFANTLSERECISQHFSRPSSPDPNTNAM